MSKKIKHIKILTIPLFLSILQKYLYTPKKTIKIIELEYELNMIKK